MHADAKADTKSLSNPPRQYRLPTASRMRRPEHFQHVFASKDKFVHRFAVVYGREAQANCPMFAVIASKKCGNAVKRNRLKRLFREFYRLHRSEIATKTDYIFIARRTDELKLQDLEQALLAPLSSFEKKQVFFD